MVFCPCPLQSGHVDSVPHIRHSEGKSLSSTPLVLWLFLTCCSHGDRDLSAPSTLQRMKAPSPVMSLAGRKSFKTLLKSGHQPEPQRVPQICLACELGLAGYTELSGAGPGHLLAPGPSGMEGGSPSIALLSTTSLGPGDAGAWTHWLCLTDGKSTVNTVSTTTTAAQ